MNYVTVLITSTHRKMLQFQTRRQAHLPLADVEEVVARLLPRAVDWGERMGAVVVEHAPQRWQTVIGLAGAADDFADQ